MMERDQSGFGEFKITVKEQCMDEDRHFDHHVTVAFSRERLSSTIMCCVTYGPSRGASYSMLRYGR